MKRDTPKSEFHVDNKEFTQAVILHSRANKEAKASGNVSPRVSEYIGECIMKISEGLSLRPNFIGYSYRDLMVSDAQLNCLTAINNYDPEAATRSGNPNAHGYFSQIAYWAMVRRIQTEEKETNIRLELINKSGIDAFFAPGDTESIHAAAGYVNELRSNTSSYEKKKNDSKTGHYGWGSPPKAKGKKKKSDSSIINDTETPSDD